MRLSIYPSVQPLPQSKADKAEAATKAVVPEIVEITTEEDLIRVVQNYVWSPSVFNGTRKKSNFKSSDFAVLDIDEGLTIDEAEKIISEANYACLCLPSLSHTPENHRFRLIFPLSRTITKEDVYVATMEDLYEVFPMADKSCLNDTARLYFQSNLSDGFWLEGDLLDPVIPPEKHKKGSRRDFDSSVRVKVPLDKKDVITELYGEERESIPEVVDYFIDNAHTGIEGNWTNTLNSLVFTLSLQEVDFDTVYDFVEYYAPDPLDDRDIKTIEKAYSDGEEVRED